ncbi:MAG: hypothetical protein JST50_15155 [Bacteroidetes bacterium]|jgi:hypothetical protein|nr:hypothetical protein [Bacteroidota bacterium]
MILPELFNTNAPDNSTGMFARLFCALLAVLVSFNFVKQYRYFLTQPLKLYGKGPRLLGLLLLPALNRYQFLTCGAGFILCLLLVVLNMYPYIAIAIALICYFLYFSQIISLAFIQRKANLIPIVLLILLFSPSLDKPLHFPSSTWELVLIKIVLIQVYFSAAIQKIRHSGLGWLNGQYLQAYLIENYIWTDRNAALAIASNTIFCAILSTLVLIFELTFGLVLFLPQLTFIYVGFALLFHLGTLITMRINYLKYLGPVYLVFFTDLAFRLKTVIGL